jgi:hypothetical protein
MCAHTSPICLPQLLRGCPFLYCEFILKPAAATSLNYDAQHHRLRGLRSRDGGMRWCMVTGGQANKHAPVRAQQKRRSNLTGA